MPGTKVTIFIICLQHVPLASTELHCCRQRDLKIRGTGIKNKSPGLFRARELCLCFLFIYALYLNRYKFYATVVFNQFSRLILKFQINIPNLSFKSPNMHTNPKENRTCLSGLVEQFRHKGYQCTEIKEADAVVVIFKHGKKNDDLLSQVLNEKYKNLFKSN